MARGARRLAASIVLAVAASTEARAGSPPAPSPPSATGSSCDADPVFHQLDFWLGDWSVVSDGREVGTNLVEKILGGCAVAEHWRDEDGSRGDSLFFVAPPAKRWKQVWVTDHAAAPGGLKEKQLVARFPGGGTRFQGEIPLPDGRVVLDRTTLTPETGGRVRQVIEISRDGGSTWIVGFDALYVPRARPEAAKR